MPTIHRSLSVVALLAVALWLGGLVALGAIAAPIVFAVVSWPSNADAMTLVFRRFDLVAMSCAAVVLATEAAYRISGGRGTKLVVARTIVSLVAAAAAVFEGASVSPRIAALHAAGAIRGVDSAGLELARLHDLAEWCGKMQVVLLAAVVALHAIIASNQRAAGK